MHCPSCGTLMNIQDKNLLLCPNCKHEEHNNPRPTNGAIIKNEKGEILLTKRKFDPKKGYWDIAGGFVNVQETIEESLRREIKEELGVDIISSSYLTSQFSRYLYKGENLHTLMFAFIVEIPIEKIKAGDDVSEVRFFAPDKIPYEEMAFEGITQILKEYLKK